jgi:DNA polymerase IV
VNKIFIAHIDLDCFFVSVERISDSALIGKPVVVGGSAEGRGVIASASYEARKYGVRSAMSTAQALRLCPQLIVVHGHHSEYSSYSNRLYKRMLDIAPIVERASIDEMYLDFTGCESLFKNDLPGYMIELQYIVLKEFNLPCTIALASNKLVAKIAANQVKPNGVIFVPHGTEENYLAPLPIGVIPGVGKKTEELLKRNGFQIVEDLQKVNPKSLQNLLGISGEWICKASHGVGSSRVKVEHTAKSISKVETFSKDISDTAELEKYFTN